MTAVRRVLVTNDDGVLSEGIRHLAIAARDLGLDVVVAAPLHDASGTSAGLSATETDGRVVVERHCLAGLDGVEVYGVEAAPGFISLIGCRGAFGAPPDLVLSGINRGANTGHAVLHSGTVGAALTAQTHGRPALAVSVASGRPQHWATAASVATTVIPALVDARSAVVINLNVPDVAPDDLRGIRMGRLARFGAVQANIAETGEGFVRIAVEDIEAAHEPGTDAALVADGYASVTVLDALREAGGVELPGLGDRVLDFH